MEKDLSPKNIWVGVKTTKVQDLCRLALLTLSFLMYSLLTPTISPHFPPPLPAPTREADAPVSFSGSPTRPAASQQAAQGFSAFPLTFEPNLGQSDSQARFIAHGSGFTAFLTTKEAVLASGPKHVLRVQPIGAQVPQSVYGADPLPGKSHYLLGSDARRWHRDIPSYRKVR